MEPTARLYARDEVWCSLNPDSGKDRRRFLDLMNRESPGRPTVTEPVDHDVRPESTLRVAMVFPTTTQEDIPTLASFSGETVDFVLFPEAYIHTSQQRYSEALKSLASDLGTPLLVGASDGSADSKERYRQVLLRFDPDGSRSRVYVKHSTAKAVAFGRPDWEASSMLPTFELSGVTAGATICHDHYLGLLARSLARRGARLWINPSYDNVVDVKWSSILRLRAVENRLYALCTLHRDMEKRTRTHPFAFAPDGSELAARKAGSGTARPLSECSEADEIYIVDLDMTAVGEPLDWSKIPPPKESKRARNGIPVKPIRVALRGGRPTVVGCECTYAVDWAVHAETDHGPVYVGMVPGERILDAAECFRVLDRAKQMNCAPIIWNLWNRLPAKSEHVAPLMMGRAIECCAPIVISDRDEIHEVVELANKNKFPARRLIESSGETIIDMGNAWGLDSAFKMVASYLPARQRGIALDRYRSLS